jgi:hypothetical protein
MKTILYPLFLLLLSYSVGFGQVINDHIENRLDLLLDASPSFSSTAGCTVERACINEALADNCIKFHNDQWFQFKTSHAGTYYLNVSGQDCRDILGVQLLVIDGIPCQPKTYQVVSCVSLATQDDIYLQLDSLKANYTYLLNLDGYLHDFCQFSIQFSAYPKGIPARNSHLESQLTALLQENTVALEWTVSEQQAKDIGLYKILRRYEQENRFTSIQEINHKRDSYGQSVLSYTFTDTLRQLGTVQYKLIAELQDHALLQLGEEVVKVKPIPYTNKDRYVTIKLNYKTGTPLSIYVMRADNKRILKKTEMVFDKQHNQLRIDTEQFKKKGITRIEVKTTDHKHKESKSQFFDLL